MYRKPVVIACSTDGTPNRSSAERHSLPSCILATTPPDEAKYLARSISLTGAQEKEWQDIGFGVVVDGNWCKFMQISELGVRLLATGDRMLVEASPSDRTWGIGFSAEDAPSKEVGWAQNKLESVLMEVREFLRDRQQ